MDPNTALETAKEGAKAFTKLGDIVEKFFGPKLTRKQADADKYANDKKLELIRENPDMDIVFINGEMSARERTLIELKQRADRRILAEKIRQEANLEKVIDIAAEDLKYDDYIDEDVDDDWIVRLFNIVKDVSNEDMQLLWGKILAGEIKRPGSFSLRTLETIRNISIKEAETFQKIIPFVMKLENSSYFIASETKILKENNIRFEDILLLDEAGFINSRELSAISKVKEEKRAVAYTNKYIIVLTTINGYVGEYNIHTYTLTKAGCELYNLLCCDTNIDYVKAFAEMIHKDNIGKIELSIHRVEEVIEDTINYEDDPIERYN